ncbi:hypothetical protein H2248_002716 [Termitomyces sp. 'cryptogamus']|nr:hypothetical protein H2248_002716 [Termitomyces sp. 'cryptogamus']
MSAAHDIYAEQLSECGLEFPLYFPEPEDDWLMEIGDIGFIKQVAFCCLFNATRPANHPVQRIGLLIGFVFLNVKHIPTFEAALEPGPLSRSVDHVGLFK